MVTIVGLCAQCQSITIAERQYQLQITPHLSVSLSKDSAYVGSGKPTRQDDLICVPITVFNNSDAYALDVEVNLLMSYAKGAEVDLNAYLRKKKRNVVQVERMEKGTQWRIPQRNMCISVNPSEFYKSGRETCRVKVQVTWSDSLRRQHRLVHLAELVLAEVDETVPEHFWFHTVASYSTLGGWKEKWLVNRYWGLPFRNWPAHSGDREQARYKAGPKEAAHGIASRAS